MEARTQLAALDHNFNVGRHQAMASSGELRYESQFSRHKGDYVAKKVYVEKSYDDVCQLMNKVQQAAFGKEFPPIPVLGTSARTTLFSPFVPLAWVATCAPMFTIATQALYIALSLAHSSPIH